MCARTSNELLDLGGDVGVAQRAARRRRVGGEIAQHFVDDRVLQNRLHNIKADDIETASNEQTRT